MHDRMRIALGPRPWLFAALLALVLLVANVAADSTFASPGNWPNELIGLAPVVLVAFASTPAIVAGGGGLDLSVGPLAVLVNVVLVSGLLAHHIDSVWEDLPLLLALGLVVGAVNGVLVAYFRYIPIIATLCMMFVLIGISSEAGSVPAPAGKNWTQHLAGSVGPVPGAVILMVVPIGLWLVLARTSYHRNLYGVGGNDATAFSAGVDVARTRVIAYALGGLFAAIGGIALTALVQTSQASLSTYYVLVGVTAVALGGTPLIGGHGGMRGSFYGAVILYLIEVLLTSLNVSANWIDVAYGGLLFVGVVVSATMVLPSSRNAAA